MKRSTEDHPIKNKNTNSKTTFEWIWSSSPRMRKTFDIKSTRLQDHYQASSHSHRLFLCHHQHSSSEAHRHNNSQQWFRAFRDHWMSSSMLTVTINSSISGDYHKSTQEKTQKLNKSCSSLAFEDPRLMTLADRCLGGGQYTVYYFGGLSILQWTRSASSCKWINLLWSLWTGQSNRDHPLMTRENFEWPRTKCVCVLLVVDDDHL